MRLVIVGTGYVGLVAAAGFAETGNHVIAVDIDNEKLCKLKNAEIPFYEPGLGELVKRNYEAGRLLFSADLSQAVSDCDIAFIAVGTPSLADGSADLSMVKTVLEDIAKAAQGDLYVVIKSTVPVGTNSDMQALAQNLSEHRIELASNPEFLKEGAAVDDFFKPDRVILGIRSQQAQALFRQLYAPFTRRSERLLFMDPESAEMSKYAANCMLAARITLMNEFANFCEHTGADIDAVRRAVGSDKRIGNAFLFPGVGYGGSCFPKDVRAMIQQGNSLQSSMHILESVHHVNEQQKHKLWHNIHTHFHGELAGRKIAIWGLSFKPNTDDIREAPALVTIDKLIASEAKVHVHDPEALDNVKAIYGDKLSYHSNSYDTLQDADALVIHTEWNEYRNPDFLIMHKKMKQAAIFDGRNLYQPQLMHDREFLYFPIGRAQSSKFQ